MAHGFVSGGRRVQVIAAIEGRQQAVGVIGIANHCIEIDNTIEMAGDANPLIHGLAIGFAHRTWMVIIRTYVWRYRSAEDEETMRVRAFNQLSVG